VRGLTILLAVFSAAAVAYDIVPKAFTESPLIRQGQYTMWHDPGDVAALDFRYGIGGRALVPQPPFTFADVDRSGTTPKVSVKDAAGRKWVIKFGDEASPDTFCTRLAWACGYYVEPTYFVADGTILGAPHGLKDIDGHGRFHSGRFQLRSSDPKFLQTIDWSWNQNPFVGTPELNGLKVLMMLLSNWDDKDARDADTRGTNTAIYQEGNLLIYFIDDWGGSMGHWGGYFTRSKWDSASFVRESPDFVKLENGGIHWGYSGQHTVLLTRDIQFSDVAWLMKYLGRVTDDQLRTGLASSGASPEQTASYTGALRMRIQELQKIALTVSRP